MEEVTPEVTVVIPTLSNRGTLRRSVSTALAQREVDLEVLIVDDASEAPVSGAEEWLVDHRVRVAYRETRGGSGAARNTGIALARGEWIAFLDDDDFWAPTKLRSQLAAAESQDADFAYADAVAIADDGRGLRWIHLPQPEQMERAVLRRNSFPTGPSNVLVRRTLLERIGPFDGRLTFAADWEMWIRMSKEGRGAAVPEVLVAYVDHAAGMTRLGDYDHASEIQVMRDRHSELFSAGGRCDEADLHRYLAGFDFAAGRHRSSAGHYLVALRESGAPGDLLKAVVAGLGGLTPTARAVAFEQAYTTRRVGGAGRMAALFGALGRGRSAEARGVDPPVWVGAQLATPPAAH